MATKKVTDDNKHKETSKRLEALEVRTMARIARLREALRNIQGLTKFDHDKSVYRECSDALIEDGSDVITLHCVKCGSKLACDCQVHPAGRGQQSS